MELEMFGDSLRGQLEDQLGRIEYLEGHGPVRALREAILLLADRLDECCPPTERKDASV
jgi:hypothetical protein